MEIEKRLKELEQDTLLERLKIATPIDKSKLLSALNTIDWDLFESAFDEMHHDADDWNYANLLPPIAAKPPKIPLKTALNNTPLACVILAGGQGTRLQFAGPKGIFPLGSTTLFELHIERLKKLSKTLSLPLFIAIMTSSATHAATKSYFEKMNWFSIQDQITLFQQKNLPLLSEDEEIIVQDDLNILQGPDGNGGLFEAMNDAGLLAQWQKANISSFAVFPVDNALAEPFEEHLVAQHFTSGDEMTWAAIQRLSEFEKVGLFVRSQNTQFVVEYSEVDPQLAESKDKEGNLLFNLANISQFFVKTETAIQLSTNKTAWHVAKKKVGDHNVLKLERFIFDHLPRVTSLSLVEIDRERYFAPIKNATGVDSPEEALTKLYSFSIIA